MSSWFGVDNWVDGCWLGVGFLGQLLFTSRFLVQWLASERRRDSVVPNAFWWFSLAGGLTLLSYAVFRLKDPVIIVGQGAGVFIYTRNLYLIARARRESGAETPRETAAEGMLPPEVRAHPASSPPAPNGQRADALIPAPADRA